MRETRKVGKERKGSASFEREGEAEEGEEEGEAMGGAPLQRQQQQM